MRVSRFIPMSLAVFCLPLLGCFNESAKQQHLSIVFVQSWADDVNPAFMAIAQDWARSRGAKASVEIVPIRDLDLKMTAWIQAPEGDLALLPTNIAMVNTDQLRDVSPIAAELSKDAGGYYVIGKDMAQFAGIWYNIPFCAWPHVWFYREDLLRAHHSSIPQTLDDAAKLAILLTDKGAGVYGLGIGLGQDEDFSMFLQTLLWSFGGSVVAGDGKTVVLDSKETRDTVSYILGLYQQGAIPPGALGWDGATNNNLFLAKKIAMTANALSIDYVAKRRDPALFALIAHCGYPLGPKGRFGFVQGFGWTIKKRSNNAILAEDFLRYLYAPDRLAALFEKGEGAIAPLQNSIGQRPFWKTGRYADAIDSVENAKALGWPGPFTRPAAEVFNRRLVNGIFARIINDKLSVDAAVREAATRISQVYSNANR